MFEKGVASYGTGAIVAVFVGLAGLLQFKREQSKHPVSRMPHFQVVMKSLLPGFSFGSELFLVMGIYEGGMIFAVLILIFRLLHAVGGTIVMISLFGSLLTFRTDYMSILENSMLRVKNDSK